MRKPASQTTRRGEGEGGGEAVRRAERGFGPSASAGRGRAGAPLPLGLCGLLIVALSVALWAGNVLALRVLLQQLP